MATGDYDDATVAAVFRAALSLGIATPADLVPWADEQVMKRERPAEWILELSLSAGREASRVEADLTDASFRADREAVFSLLVGLADVAAPPSFEQGRLAAAWLYDVALGYTSGYPQYQAAWIDERFDRAAGTIIPSDGLAAELTEYVRKNADPAARAWLPGVRVTFGGEPAPPSAGMMDP
jgi:hypothetical protein